MLIKQSVFYCFCENPCRTQEKQMFPDKCFVINAYVGLASQQAEEVALEAFRVAL